MLRCLLAKYKIPVGQLQGKALCSSLVILWSCDTMTLPSKSRLQYLSNKIRWQGLLPVKRDSNIMVVLRPQL